MGGDFQSESLSVEFCSETAGPKAMVKIATYCNFFISSSSVSFFLIGSCSDLELKMETPLYVMELLDAAHQMVWLQTYLKICSIILSFWFILK